MIEVMLILSVIAVLLAFAVSVFTHEDTCIRQHKGPVHHNAYTSFIFVGKGVMMPIYHPAQDVEEWICDERRTVER